MSLLNPALKDFWKTKARVKVLYGGRASSKTWDAAGTAVFIAHNYKVRFLCTRQFQNRITESVYTNLKQQIERMGLTDYFEITNNRIRHKETGAEFLFYGLWRNIDEIKSMEGIDYTWIEEAHNLTKDQWEVLEPTLLRKDNSQVWIIFNPRMRTDFVYKNFVVNTPPDCLLRKVNYDENPFLSEQMLNIIEEKKQENEEDFRHIYLGEPRNDAENSLFDYQSVDNAMNRNGDPSGAKVLGVDVARFGDDKSAHVIREGLYVHPIETRSKQLLTETTGWTANVIVKEHIDGTIIDTIGMGMSIHDHLMMQGFYCVDGNFGMNADDKETYINKRAESYFRLRDAIDRGLSLPRDEELLEELVSITYQYTETGKIKITPKDKIKEELGRSPDKADALALTFFAHIHKQHNADSFNDEYIAPNLI